jgi:hypothetical protein
MELHVLRELHAESTPGVLRLRDADDAPWTYFCDTLEDAVRERINDEHNFYWKPEFKIDHETAIPSGTYEIIVDFSNRFQKEMCHILNVPSFTGIRIHSGETISDTDGCLLVGFRSEGMHYATGRRLGAMLIERIKAEMAMGRKVFITFENGR